MFFFQTVDICKKFMNIRSNYTNTIIGLMKKSVANGSPLNPPVWWIDPTDPVAQSIDDGKTFSIRACCILIL